MTTWTVAQTSVTLSDDTSPDPTVTTALTSVANGDVVVAFCAFVLEGTSGTWGAYFSNEPASTTYGNTLTGASGLFTNGMIAYEVTNAAGWPANMEVEIRPRSGGGTPTRAEIALVAYVLSPNAVPADGTRFFNARAVNQDTLSASSYDIAADWEHALFAVSAVGGMSQAEVFSRVQTEYLTYQEDNATAPTSGTVQNSWLAMVTEDHDNWETEESTTYGTDDYEVGYVTPYPPTKYGWQTRQISMVGLRPGLADGEVEPSLPDDSYQKCLLHIPHHRWLADPDPVSRHRKVLENWAEVEAWAARFLKDCVPCSDGSDPPPETT